MPVRRFVERPVQRLFDLSVLSLPLHAFGEQGLGFFQFGSPFVAVKSSIVNSRYLQPCGKGPLFCLIASASPVEDNLISRQPAQRSAVVKRRAVNLPNYITLTRIFSVPVLIWILSSSRFSSAHGEKELLASALFIAASLTDMADGYLARHRGQITTLGMLLDPLADKLLVAAAFVTLVQFNPRVVPAWMAVVIIGREFLVSGLRSIAATEGFTIAASDLGKFKMVVQIVAVVAAILDHHWMEWPLVRGWFLPIHVIAFVAIWFMVVLSLVSAIDYFAAFWSKIDRHVVKRRRRAFVLTRRRSKSDVPATQ
jgi:CDP-diacylglycerol--glycerol-3-phosphate 3-phosphatidyltransferase